MKTPRMFLTPLVVLLLWLGGTALGGNAVEEAMWEKQFTLDLWIPGYGDSARAQTAASCAVLCARRQGCLSYGFSAGNATCLLFDHLVTYTTHGDAAARTGYYWMLSPRCRDEYTLKSGVCFVVRQQMATWQQAQGFCKAEGAVLMIVDSMEKVEALQGQLTSKTWVGASDAEEEDVWTWENGRRLSLGSSLWSDWQPDDFASMQDYLALEQSNLLDDYFNGGSLHFACQVPMQ